MKIFKWWQKLILLLSIFLIAAMFAAVSFFSSIENVQRWSLFSTMFFGLASASLSFVALSISVLAFIKTSKKEQEEIQNTAKQFIIENSNEIDYIPLCIIANYYDKHRKYYRKIYTAFNKLNPILQSEVLQQLNYNKCFCDSNWVRTARKRIETFVEENELGENFIFDYYEKTLVYASEIYDNKENDSIISSRYLGYPSCVIENGKMVDKGISFKKYVTLYLFAKRNNDYKLATAPKPLDILANNAKIDDSNEKNSCFWSICAADAFAEYIVDNQGLKTKREPFPKVHAIIETFEDRFLLSLSTLYNLNHLMEIKK